MAFSFLTKIWFCSENSEILKCHAMALKKTFSNFLNFIKQNPKLSNDTSYKSFECIIPFFIYKEYNCFNVHKFNLLCL